MWNRQQVKEQAKQIMKRNYWKMFVVALIAGILSGDYVTVIQTVQDFALMLYCQVCFLQFFHFYQWDLL